MQTLEKQLEGLSIAIAHKSAWIERFRKMRPKSYLYLPRESECEHFSITGAPGSGKTTSIQHLVDSFKARARREGRRCVCVFFDPHCTFIQRYYKPGAWVGNPYDQRSFSWCPTWELDLNRRRWSMARALGMARSLYVGKQNQTSGDNSSEFFNRTSQLMFTQLVVDHQPAESQELAYWFENPDEEIATRVTGKVKKDIDPGSPAQVNGIYSSASMPQLALEAIPLAGWMLPDGTWHENAPRFTIREWSAKREHDIFLTSTADTIDALQPMQSMWLDMIFRQIIADGTAGIAPTDVDVMVVIDEVAALQRLPLLQKFANESRKFNARLVLGYQARAQFDAIYGRDMSTAIIAACKHQIYHRAGEFQSAKDQSDNIGEIWYEELRESWTTTLGQGNKPRNVNTEVKKKLLMLPSDFKGLRDREAIMQFENQILRYKVAISPPYSVAPPTIDRADTHVTKGVKRPPEPKPDPKAKGKKPPKGKAKGKGPAVEPDTTMIAIGVMPGEE